MNRYGLTQYPFSLAAEILEGAWAGFWLTNASPPGQACTAVYVRDDGIYDSTVLAPLVYGHFPYGYSVEPDIE